MNGQIETTTEVFWEGGTAALAFIVCGMALWVLWWYTKRVHAAVRGNDRRSGLLPIHVAFVTSYAIMAEIRMVMRDRYETLPPLWLDWPATLFLTTWLGVAMVALVALYLTGPTARHTLRHPPPGGSSDPDA